MFRFSYLKQLAQRTNGSLPIVMPSRSPFQTSTTMQSVESVPAAENVSTVRMPSLFPSPIEGSKTTPAATVIEDANPVRETVASSPDLPVESPAVEILSSPPIVSFPNSTPLNPTKPIAETISSSSNLTSGAETSDRDSSSSSVTDKSQPDRQMRVNTSPPIDKQQSESILPTSVEIEFPRRHSTLSQKNNSDNFPRLSPVADRDRVVPTEEIATYPMPSYLPAKSQPELSTGNSIHIGAIEIQITPPAPLPPPPQVTSPVAKPTSTAPLSRGFSSSFGWRQG